MPTLEKIVILFSFFPFPLFNLLSDHYRLRIIVLFFSLLVLTVVRHCLGAVSSYVLCDMLCICFINSSIYAKKICTKDLIPAFRI